MIKSPGYWTKERCREEALKYSSRKEFSKKGGGACGAAYKNGWLDEICSHMFYKPKGYWTKDRCQEEALKYISKTEFNKRNIRVYRAAVKKGWLDEICSHMHKTGNLFVRQVYAFEFDDKVIYIGISYDVQKRKYEHLHKSSSSKVKKHISDNNVNFCFKTLSDLIDVKEAVKLERFYIDKYRNEGYTVLNSSKGGELGKHEIHWTKELCREEALKYQTKKSFVKEKSGAYNVIRKNRWIEEMCSHMIELKKPSGHWTKELCKKEALKYNSSKEFKEKNINVYQISQKNKWFREICYHMKLTKSRGYWTKELCREEALKYKSRSELSEKSSGAYKTAYKNGWLNEICSHMFYKPNGYWTKELCREEALKYKSRTKFNKESRGASHTAARKGWLDEICSHMIELVKPKGYWTKERCQEEALKYKSKYEFQNKNATVYQAARKNKWLDEICSHMKQSKINKTTFRQK